MEEPWHHPGMDHRNDMDHLGTVLTIWAHPDDETYLVGGMSAVLTDAGHRVVCVTATRGEAGVSSDPQQPATERGVILESGQVAPG